MLGTQVFACNWAMPGLYLCITRFSAPKPHNQKPRLALPSEIRPGDRVVQTRVDRVLLRLDGAMIQIREPPPPAMTSPAFPYAGKTEKAAGCCNHPTVVAGFPNRSTEIDHNMRSVAIANGWISKTNSSTNNRSLHNDPEYRDRWARFIDAVCNGRSDSIAAVESPQEHRTLAGKAVHDAA